MKAESGIPRIIAHATPEQLPNMALFYFQAMTTGNRIQFVIAALALGSAVLRASPLHISGEQNGLYESNIYIVDSTVTIPEGTELTFAAGTKVCFARYSGLRVLGALKCIGTSDNPIVFTCVDNSVETDATPMPFSWNGIVIEDSAHAQFSHCIIRYSTAGLTFERSSSVRLDSVLFSQNGRSDLTIGHEPIPIEQDGLLVSYIHPESQEYDASAASPRPERIPARMNRPVKRVLFPTAITCGIAAIACVAGSRISYSRALDAAQNEDNAPSFLAASEAASEKDNAIRAREVFNISAAATGVVAIGASIPLLIARLRAK